MMKRDLFGGRRAASLMVGLWASALTVTGLIHPAGGDDSVTTLQLTPSESKQLAAAEGDPDPAVLRRITRQLGTPKLIAAIYNGTRSERLTALDAAAYVDVPTAIIPTLAALLGASDRQTAARAAGALLTILFDPAARAEQTAEMIPAQAVQIITQLIPIARDKHLDADVRVTAVTCIDRLSRVAPLADPSWSLSLLEDGEPLVREVAIAFQRIPLSKEALMTLAKLSTEDTDGGVRGVSATVLCENALSHGVKEPSQDLAILLASVAKDPLITADSMAGVFKCLGRFDSGERRRSVFEAARLNPNENVRKLLESLNLK